MNATAEFTSIRNKKGIMTNIRVTDVLQINVMRSFTSTGTAAITTVLQIIDR